MSHHQSKADVSFRCDASQCGETFDSPILSIKGAWSEAEAFGWRTRIEYDKNVSVFRHYCPSHAKVEGIR
jgi:hypothetical protein